MLKCRTQLQVWNSLLHCNNLQYLTSPQLNYKFKYTFSIKSEHSWILSLSIDKPIIFRRALAATINIRLWNGAFKNKFQFHYGCINARHETKSKIQPSLNLKWRSFADPHLFTQQFTNTNVDLCNFGLFAGKRTYKFLIIAFYELLLANTKNNLTAMQRWFLFSSLAIIVMFISPWSCVRGKTSFCGVCLWRENCKFFNTFNLNLQRIKSTHRTMIFKKWHEWTKSTQLKRLTHMVQWEATNATIPIMMTGCITSGNRISTRTTWCHLFPTQRQTSQSYLTN